MALTYGFFDSVDGDRVYNAETISDMFRGLVSDGVYQLLDGAFRVTASGGLTVSVATGRAVVEDKWAENDAPITLTLSASHVTLARYTAIVLRKNYSARTVTLEMVDGTPASNPAMIQPTRDGVTTYELILAQIYVAPGATAITQADITDERNNSAVCGYITGLIQQVDTSTLFAQYEAAYAEQLAYMTAWMVEQRAAYESWFDTLTQQLQVNTFINRHQKAFTMSADSAAMHFSLIFDDEYVYKSGDAIEVFVNGLHLKDSEYTLEQTLGGYFTAEIDNLKKGTVVDFVVYESKIGDPISQGATVNQYSVENVTQSNSTFTAEEEG